MPVYQYQGVHYSLPDGLSNEQAIGKIRSHLGEASIQPISKPEDAAKGTTDAVESGHVYVKPILGLSAEKTAGLYSFAESASSTLRGIGQMLGFHADQTKEEVQKREALQKNPEYRTGANVGAISGTIADPITYALPLGKAATLGQFIKQSAVMGGITGFAGASSKEGMQGRGTSAAEGAVGGAVGGAVLGTAMRAGAKLFGKDFLPWKATPEEKKAVVEEVKASEPEAHVESVKHFMDAPEDAHINAKKKAEDLIEKGAPKKITSAAIKKDPLVGHYLEEYQTRYEALKESKVGEVKQGEVLPPETKPAEEQLKLPSGQVPQEGQPKLPNLQAGNVSTQVATHLAGAGIGAMLDPQDPATGAVLGLAAAHGGWKALAKVTDTAIEKVAKETPVDIMQGARKAIGMTVNEVRDRQRSSFTIANHADELIKGDSRKEAVTHAMENPSLSSSLTSEERKGMEILKKGYADLGERAKQAGVIKELRENYITHIVDLGKDKSKMKESIDFFLGKSGGTSGAGRATTKFGKERTYDTIKDLEDAGFKVKTKDAVQLYKIYANSVERAIAGKNLVTHLSGKVLPEGKSAMVKLGAKQSVPFGWEVNSAIPGYAIHPDIAPLMEHVFTSDSPGALMSTATSVTNAVKRLNVLGTFFHSYNLFGSLALSGPTTAIKELATGFKGIRGAKEAFEKGKMGDAVSQALKNGLVLEAPIDVDKHVFGHIGALADSIAEKGGFSLGAEKGGKALEKYTTGITDKVTWDYMHTGGKILAYNKMMETALANHPTEDPAVLGKEVAKFVNNAFGGLNWTQIASDSNKTLVHELTNPKSRAVMALATFAPDWTLSTLRVAMDAFSRKGTGLRGIVSPKTSTDLSRQYMLRTTLAYFTLFNGMNLALSGHNIWENKDPSRIEFSDGTSMQVAKHAMEPLEWTLNPEKTLANKMAFLPRAALLYWGEKQYPFGPALQDKSGIGKIEQIGKMALPFQVSAAMGAPEGEGLSRALAGTAGIPVYGMTKEQRMSMRNSVEARQDRAQKRRDKMIEMRRKIYGQ